MITRLSVLEHSNKSCSSKTPKQRYLAGFLYLIDHYRWAQLSPQASTGQQSDKQINVSAKVLGMPYV